MPRGNDFAPAVLELQQQYGAFENADELIRAHRASSDPAVARAGVLPVNEEETAVWRKERRGEAAEKLGTGPDEILLDVVQRGNALSGVIQNAAGDIRKAVAGANDLYVAPALPQAEQDDRDRFSRDQAISAEVARLRAESEQQLQQVKAELAAEQSLAIEQMRAEVLAVVSAAPQVAEEPEAPEPDASGEDATVPETEPVVELKPKPRSRRKLAEPAEAEKQ